jgi:hypothetical protein
MDPYTILNLSITLNSPNISEYNYICAYVSQSSRVKNSFYSISSSTYFSILVNKALNLRIDIRVIPYDILFFPFSLILRYSFIKFLPLEALMPTMTITYRSIVLSILSICVYLRKGGCIFGGGREEFGRAKTRRFGSLFLYLFFL